MDLTHRFTVPTGVDETWSHFQDIASVAECFPGASVTSVDGDHFSGSVKVKLGPIALVYNGSGQFVEKDEAAYRFVVEAKGKDKRGNGTAGATVTLTMAPAASADAAGSGATDVEVVTDLSITGKPAQFGRGVMQDVSDKLLGQFTDCLEQRLAGPSEAVVPDDRSGDTPAEPADRQGLPEAPAPAGAVSTDETVVPEAAEQPERPGISPPRAAAAPASHRDDSLDLGTTVLPVLARAYWKPAAGVLAGVLLLWWVVSRSRR